MSVWDGEAGALGRVGDLKVGEAAWKGETGAEKDVERLQRTLRPGPEQVCPQSLQCFLDPPISVLRASWGPLKKLDLMPQAWGLSELF